MEFGGRQNAGESDAQTALREFMEETAYAVPIELETVLRAERNGHFIDHINPSTGFSYRMYYIHMPTRVPIANIQQAAKELNSKHTEKLKYKYIPTNSLFARCSVRLYPTMIERLTILRSSPDFHEFLLE